MKAMSLVKLQELYLQYIAQVANQFGAGSKQF